MNEIENIEVLVAKEFSGNLTDQERQELTNWRANSLENENVYQEFKSSWNLVGSSKSFDINKAWKKVDNKIAEQKKETVRHNISFYRVAAAIVLGIGISWFFLMNNEEQSTLELAWSEVKASGMEDVLLSDSSTIALTEGAVLAYPQQFLEEERSVEFKGKAFFDIHRDTIKSFVIKTPYASVRVLGTSFLLETDSLQEHLKVYVASGVVSVRGLLGKDSIVLTKGEMALVGREQKLVSETPPNIIAWKNKKIKFRNTSLREVFKTLEEVYGVSVFIKDEALLNCLFTGKFNKKSFKSVLNQLSEMYGFDFKIERKEAIITGGDAC